VSTEFHKFPSTPHLAWLGRSPVRDDKVLSPPEAADFLRDEIVVEEKIDGANLGISVNEAGELQFQNRGNLLTGSLTGQWKPIRGWMASHLSGFRRHLRPDLILFGEWCQTRHSIQYDLLPDWFLVFDIYDRDEDRFWSAECRDSLASDLRLATVPRLFAGHTDLSALRSLVQSTTSSYGDGPLEGIVIRREEGDWLAARAKLVHPQFTKGISDHWSRGRIFQNRLVSGSS